MLEIRIPGQADYRLEDLVPDVNGTLAVDEVDRVVGIVTNGDLVDRGGLRLRLELLSALTTEQLARELAALEDEKTVTDVVTRPAVTVGPERNLADVAHLMVTRQLKRLPVVNQSRVLVGMVSVNDDQTG